MKKVLKWVGIVFLGLIVLGMVIDAMKSPEQKAAEAAAQTKEQERRAVDEAKEAAFKQEQEIQDSVPKCDGRDVSDTIKNTFDQSQFARTLNLSAVEVLNFKETSFDSKGKSRSCVGQITMNNASTVDATCKFEGRAGGQFLVTCEFSDHS